MSNDDKNDVDDDWYDLDAVDQKTTSQERLRSHPIFWGIIGVTQTLLTSGVIFGWASLLPVIRNEGVDYTPEQFSLIFTAGAIGNYMSTLGFGLVLDNFGPKTTGILSSMLYIMGLFLCSFIHIYYCFAIGFFIIGFAGPGIQMPTLHLANLFPSENGGTGALYMSAQAAAFDGGTAVFAIVRLIYQLTGFSASSFFLLYTIIPVWSLLTAIFFWPNDILENPNIDEKDEDEYMGIGSPYLSASGRMSVRNGNIMPNALVNAPLSTVVKHPAFYSLATWAGIHILKLNFVVATINDQLIENVDEDQADHLIDILGFMLPFGFVALPIVAAFLDRAPILAFELANIIGVCYGAVMAFCPGSQWLEAFIVFPSVACSRQLVYSTLFHQVGATFGFANYGVLLGLINVMVSAFSTIQTPLVQWSEMKGSYYLANLLLVSISEQFLSSTLKVYASY